MKINKDNLQLIHSALTAFVGEPIIEASSGEDDVLYFVTYNGNEGRMEKNIVTGNWDIYIGDEVVYEMEDEIVHVMDQEEKGINLIKIYNYMRYDINWKNLKFKSRKFMQIVFSAIEKQIVFGNFPLQGSIVIDENWIVYTKGMKFNIILNWWEL